MQHSRRWLILSGTMALIIALFAVQDDKNRADDKQDPIAALSWMSGTWTDARQSGENLEEFWGEPNKGFMSGSFRWSAKDGKIIVLEILTISKEGEDVAMRLRHFDDKLKCREQDPLILKKIAGEAKSATFEGTDAKSKVTIRYSREGDELKIKLDIARDGKQRSLEFAFKKKN